MRRVLSWVVPALLGLGIAGLDIGAAASQSLTSNINNSVSTAMVAPPENVEATSTITVLPPSCAVHVSWTAPAMTGIGGYEVRRVLAAGGTELDPPTFTTDLFYDDTRTLLTLVGNAYDYQVRTVLDGTTWRSAWVTADAGLSVLCLDLAGAPESGGLSDGFAPNAVESDEAPVTSVPEADQPVSEPTATTVPPIDIVPTTSTVPPDTSPETTAPVTTLLATPLAVVTGS